MSFAEYLQRHHLGTTTVMEPSTNFITIQRLPSSSKGDRDPTTGMVTDLHRFANAIAPILTQFDGEFHKQMRDQLRSRLKIVHQQITTEYVSMNQRNNRKLDDLEDVNWQLRDSVKNLEAKAQTFTSDEEEYEAVTSELGVMLALAWDIRCDTDETMRRQFAAHGMTHRTIDHVLSTKNFASKLAHLAPARLSSQPLTDEDQSGGARSD